MTLLTHRQPALAGQPARWESRSNRRPASGPARLGTGGRDKYFFLVLVGDHRGLSYYSRRSISSYLKLPAEGIETARTSLCDRGLIAYEAPLYEVLSLPVKAERSSRRPSASRGLGGEPRPLEEILTNLELLKVDRDVTPSPSRLLWPATERHRA